MTMGLTALDFVVLSAILLAIAFTAAWACSAKLRNWIERPKYRFLVDVEGYDEGVAPRK